MLKVYDTMELNNILKMSNEYRSQSYMAQSLEYNYMTLKEDDLNALNFRDEVEELYEKDPSDPFNYEEYIGLNYEGDDATIKEEVEKINYLTKVSSEYSELLSGYSTLHAGGRMNVELTPYRHDINKFKLDIIEKFGYEDSKIILNLKEYETESYLRAEQVRYEKLLSVMTADDFNNYTVTVANYPGKAVEGYMLFVIMVFVLALFYDLFSKDFEFNTYRTVYTEPHTRKSIVNSKILFAILYTVLLIGIGMLITTLYLLFSKRIGYNIISNRIGYMFHPVLINTNIFSMFGHEPIYSTVPVILKNIVMLIVGLSLVYLWIQCILYLSLKSKSSATTLTISVFVLMAAFFVNLTNFKDILSFLIPIFGFNFNKFFDGSSNFYLAFFIIIIGIYNGLLRSQFKSFYSNDMLGGDSHD